MATKSCLLPPVISVFILCVWFLHAAYGVSFVASPGVVRGDVTGSAVLEWMLNYRPGTDDAVSFIFDGADVFRYIPYTGAIPPRVIDGPGGNAINSSSYDPRFAIYNTSTRGVGFRLAGLRPEDTGNYTCRFESLGAPPPPADGILFVYDVPVKPTISVLQYMIVEGTSVGLACVTTSTSLPVAHRPAMLYTWSRNGVDIDRTWPPERQTVLGDSGQTLEISPIYRTDTAYTCTASESGTEITSEEIRVTLDVLYGPHNVTVDPPRPSAIVDKVLEIRASSDCNPTCHFTWSVEDDVISHGALLRFRKFQSHDANIYTVQAENIYGRTDLTVEIKLKPSGLTILTVAATNAGLLLIVIIVSVLLCVRRRRKLADLRKYREGGNSDYVISDVSEETDSSAIGYANNIDEIRKPGSPAGYEVVSEVSKDRVRPSRDYVNSDVYQEIHSATLDHTSTEVIRLPTGNEVSSEVSKDRVRPSRDYVNSDVYQEIHSAALDHTSTEVIREPGSLADNEVSSEVSRDKVKLSRDYVNSEVYQERHSAALGHNHAEVIKGPDGNEVSSEVSKDQVKPTRDYVNSEVYQERHSATLDQTNTEVIKEPGNPADNEVSSEVSKDRVQPSRDCVNSELLEEQSSAALDRIDTEVTGAPAPSAVDDVITERRRKLGNAAGDHVNSVLCRKTNSADYEHIDMTTREPADPIDKVYATLQQPSM